MKIDNNNSDNNKTFIIKITLAFKDSTVLPPLSIKVAV